MLWPAAFSPSVLEAGLPQAQHRLPSADHGNPRKPRIRGSRRPLFNYRHVGKAVQFREPRADVRHHRLEQISATHLPIRTCSSAASSSRAIARPVSAVSTLRAASFTALVALGPPQALRHRCTPATKKPNWDGERAEARRRTNATITSLRRRGSGERCDDAVLSRRAERTTRAPHVVVAQTECRGQAHAAPVVYDLLRIGRSCDLAEIPPNLYVIIRPAARAMPPAPSRGRGRAGS